MSKSAVTAIGCPPLYWRLGGTRRKIPYAYNPQGAASQPGRQNYCSWNKAMEICHGYLRFLHCFCFYRCVLLRYNLYTGKYTNLKYIVHWILTSTSTDVNYNPIKIQNVPITLKSSLMPFPSQVPPPPEITTVLIAFATD